jgi:hypothetical protein
MADEELRSLARIASGDLEAEAELLLRRLRSGELTQERLQIVEHLGYEPAEIAVREGSSRRAMLPRDWTSLAAAGDECVVRACVAKARFVLPAWRAHEPIDPGPAEALWNAEEWLVCPCDSHARAILLGLKAGRRAMQRARQPPGWPDPESVPGRAHAAASLVYRATQAALAAHRPTFPGQLSHLAGQCLSDWRASLPALRQELIPWLLGTSDPVWARVQASKG